MTGVGRGSGGDGSKGGDSHKPTNDPTAGPDSDARFAELIGETRPLKPTAERIDPRSRRAAATTRTRARAEPNAQQGFRWPEADSPRLAAASGVSDRELRRLGRGEPEPEERVDLHGVRRDGAARLLASRLASARARGIRCVVVIHGQGRRSGSGEAVLRESLPDWLTRAPCAAHVLAFAPAPDRFGGDGATLVLLRKDAR